MGPSLDHLARMTSARGLWQHARHAVPDRRHGYCLDDNARALWLCARLARLATPDRCLIDLATVYAGFVDHAWDAAAGRWTNFMAHDGRWLPDESASGEDEDAAARALLALIETAASPLPDGLAGWALDRAAEVISSGAPSRHRAPRAWAWSLAACRAAEVLPLDAAPLGRALAGRMLRRWRASARPGWPWFEDVLAYDAGRLAQGALDAAWLGRGGLDAAWLAHEGLDAAWLAHEGLDAAWLARDGLDAPEFARPAAWPADRAPPGAAVLASREGGPRAPGAGAERRGGEQGRTSPAAELRVAGLDALAWLCALQAGPDGRFRPPGSEGYGRRGPPARFAQQPIDAWAMVEAASAAWRLTGEARWRTETGRAHAWFLGANDAGAALAEPATGACRDGIDPQGVSANRGAESTLAWLHADAALRLTQREVEGREGR